jgi:hypothetical protein
MKPTSTLRPLATLCFLFIFGITASAQLNIGGIKNVAGDALENALEKKIEKEMNKAAEKMVDKYWDRVLGKYYQGMYSSTPNGSSKNFPFMLDTTVVTREQYQFGTAVTIEVSTYKKNGKLDEAAQMKTFSSPDEQSICTEIKDDKKPNEGMYVINDFKNNAMIMLMENDGQKMSMSYGLMLDEAELANMAEQEQAEEDLPEFKDLGTKTILGYTCRGYGTEDEESATEIWVCDDDVFGMENMFAVNKEAAAQMPDNFPKGAILEMVSLEKNSNKKTVMQVVDVDKDADLTIKMADYPNYETVAHDQ